MSASKKSTANRDSIRAQVVPSEVRGLLMVEGLDQRLPFLIWDVSEHGLGIWCSTKVDALTNVKITVPKPFGITLDCRVKWCEEHANGGFRLGLKLNKDHEKLIELYKQFSSDKKP